VIKICKVFLWKINQNIGELEITMHNLLLINFFEALNKLLENKPSLNF